MLLQLQHPNIVPVYDMIVEGNNLAIIMEYQHGSNLHSMLRAWGTVAPGIALAVIERVLLALEQAHRSGVLHLDIKPDNVLFSGDFRYCRTHRRGWECIRAGAEQAGAQ